MQEICDVFIEQSLWFGFPLFYLEIVSCAGLCCIAADMCYAEGESNSPGNQSLHSLVMQSREDNTFAEEN